MESHLISKHNYTYEQTVLIDIDQFPDVVSTDSKSNKSSVSPTNSVKTPAVTTPAITSTPSPNNLQSLYSSFLMQQQQQQQQFPASLLQSALLQQQQQQQPAANGLNSMLLSTLFNQLQHQQMQATKQGDETPLDLSNSVAMSLLANGNNPLTSMAFKTKTENIEQQFLNEAKKLTNSNYQQMKPNENRSRSSSSGGCPTVTDDKKVVAPNKQSFTASQKQQQQQQQRRVRTQMTQYQVNVMRLIFAEYKTPTMNECEQMGREINLKKRVVQVWFQNARAKEKKNHPNSTRSILFSNSANNDLSNYEFSADECIMCNVKYNHNSSMPLATPGSNSQAQRVNYFEKLSLKS